MNMNFVLTSFIFMRVIWFYVNMGDLIKSPRLFINVEYEFCVNVFYIYVCDLIVS